MSEASPAALSQYPSAAEVPRVVTVKVLVSEKPKRLDTVSDIERTTIENLPCMRSAIVSLNGHDKEAKTTRKFASNFAAALVGSNSAAKQEAVLNIINNIEAEVGISIRLQTMIRVYMHEHSRELNGSFNETKLFAKLEIDNIEFRYMDKGLIYFVLYNPNHTNAILANPSGFRDAINIICSKIGVSCEWIWHGHLADGSNTRPTLRKQLLYDGLVINLDTLRRRYKHTRNRLNPGKPKNGKDKLLPPRLPPSTVDAVLTNKLSPPPEKKIEPTSIIVGQQPEAKPIPPQQKIRDESDQEPSSFATEIIDLKISDENYMDEEKLLMGRGYRSMFFKKQGIMRFYPKDHFIGGV
jgi:hypothetical protein